MTWIPINILMLLVNFFGPTPIVGTRATTAALMAQLSNGSVPAQHIVMTRTEK